MEDVAVGSVGHILVQTFKTLFPERHHDGDENDGKDEQQAQAEAAAKAAEEAAAAAAEAEALAGDDDEAAADKAAEEGDGASADAGEDDAEEGDGNGDAGGDDSKAEAEPEAEADPEAAAKAKLDAQIMAEARKRAADTIREIDAGLEQEVQRSVALTEFLQRQQASAKVADAKDAEYLRSWGLVQGSEMPIGPSNLKLEAEEMGQFGAFSDHLIVARQLMKATEDEILEKTGQLRKEKPAEIPSFSSMKGDPHYLKSTHAASVRREVMKKERQHRARAPKKTLALSHTSKLSKSTNSDVPETDGSSPSPKAQTSKGKGKGKGKTKKGEHDGLNAEQIDLERKVLERMNHKLNFLRNPRYVTQRGMAGVPNTIGVNQGGSITSKLASRKTVKKAYTTDVFEVVPPVVEFTDYDANVEFVTTIQIRNSSAVSRNLRVLPPSTRFFAMDTVEYPPGNGAIAPGMSAKVTVHFFPNSLADFEDELTVVTEQKKFTVPIRAFREPPLLSLPLTLDGRNCMLGDRLDTVFRCENSGGAGRFRLFPASDWPAPASPVYNHTKIDIEPFSLWPSEFALGTGDSIDLNLRFLPREVGSFEREFVMVCDNCEITTFKVVGKSCDLSVRVVDISGTPLPLDDAPRLPGEPLLLNTARSTFSTASSVAGSVAGGSVAGGSALARVADTAAASPAETRGTPAVVRVQSVPKLALGGAGAGAGDQADAAAPSLAAPTTAPTRPPMRLRFDPITPGMVVTRTFVAHNDTPVTLPFHWEVKEFPRVPPFSNTGRKRRRSSNGNGTVAGTVSIAPSAPATHRTRGGAQGGVGHTARSSLPPATQRTHATGGGGAAPGDGGGDGGGGGGGAGSGDGGGGDPAKAYTIEPATGNLAPNSSATFTVTFQPSAVAMYECVARLMVSGVPIDPRIAAAAAARREARERAKALDTVDERKTASVAGSDVAGGGKDATGEREALPGDAAGSAGDASSPTHPDGRPVTPDIQRQVVAATSVFLQGAGREADVLLRPAVINVPGSLTAGALAVQRVRLVNHSNATVPFEWGTARPVRSPDVLEANRMLGPGPSSGVIGDADNRSPRRGSVAQGSEVGAPAVPRLDVPPGEVGPDAFTTPAWTAVAAHPSRGTLPPRSHLDVEVSFTALEVGRHSFELPVAIANGPSGGLALQVTAVVEGPRVRITAPEVDFGLISVGSTSERVVHFENLSDAPARWVFQQTDRQLTAPQTPSSVGRGPMSVLNDDRGSVFGGGSVVNGGGPGSVVTNATPTGVDPTTRASLIFEPRFGVLAPGGSDSVRVTCAAGTKPQRLREMFECAVEQGNTAYARVRGEVQSPKVYLDTLDMPLATTFVDVPVYRTVKLHNLSNLNARFAWDLTVNLDPNRAFDIQFEPSEGTLGAKAVQEVAVTVTPLRPGRVDSVLVCDIGGMPMPLGFVLTTTVKALVVAFSTKGSVTKGAAALEDEAKAAAEAEEEAAAKALEETLATLTDPALIAEAKAMEEARVAGAEVGVVPGLNFGGDFKTFSSRTITLRVHNLSGIPTRFTAGVKNFSAAHTMTEARALVGAKAEPAAGAGGGAGAGATSRASSRATSRVPSRATTALGGRATSASAHKPVPPPNPPAGRTSRGGMATRGTARTGLTDGRTTKLGSTSATVRRRRLLGMAHERFDKYQSQAGAKMLRDREYRDVMRAMLSLKKGVAFDVVPAEAELPAWGVVEVTVTCMGDMPGNYRDEVVLDVAGLPVSRIPIKVGVVGSPLAFMENVVGMLLFKSPPMLTFGDVVKRTPAVTKVFKVRNTSPLHADVLWKMQPDFEDEPPVVTCNMQVVGDIRSAQPIRFSITPYSSDASPPPFTITPQVGRVPAHGTATFTIAATPENPPELGTGEPGSGPCYARFVADATWVLADGSAPGRGPGDSSVTVEELPSQATVGTAGAATATASRRASNAASAAPSGVEGGPSAVTAATAATETTEDLGGAGPAGTVSRACLVLRTHITPIEPVLHVDKRKPSGKKDKLPFVKFGVWSTHPGSHPSHNRQITLTNQIPTALTFTLAVEGPFTMLNARTHAPKHPLQSREGAVVNRPLSAGSTRMFTLPHLANVVVDLQFDKGLARSQYHPVANPLDTSMSRRKDGLDTQRAKDAKAATKGPLAHLARTPSVLDDAKGKLKTEYRGAIVITYANGHVQRVGLRGEILRPMLAATPPVVTFGHVHVEGYARATMHVANPTPVDAEWRLGHLPVPPPKPRVQIDATALGLASGDGSFSLAALGLTPPPESPKETPVDDPSVFEFNVRDGVLPGPTPPLDVAKAQELRVSIPGGRGKLLPIRVVFRPKKNALYRSRFRLYVRKGEGFDVVLTGHGSYEEFN